MHCIKSDTKVTYGANNEFIPRFRNDARKRFSSQDIGKQVEIEYFGFVDNTLPQTVGYSTVRGVLTELIEHDFGSCQTVYLDGEEFEILHPLADCECRVIEASH